MITPESWPTDPRECYDLLSRLAQQVDDLQAALDQSAKLHQQEVDDLQAALDQAAKLHDQTVENHKQAVYELKRQLEILRRYAFGPRRERLVEAPGQGHLFQLGESEIVAALSDPPQADSAPDRGAVPRKRELRRPEYDHLPQVRIVHDVPEADKVCDHCGEPKTRIGEDEARVLEFIPAHFELYVLVLPKYACSHYRDGVAAPEVPPRPLIGCIA
jgi:hypothetical protein